MQNENTAALLDYFAQQQTSVQWRGFLAALAQEFDSQLETSQLRQLMARIGARFASSHPALGCATLDDFAAFLNGLWTSLDWGYVNLTERDEYLLIEHCCAPLGAFGEEAGRWTPAFLEGAYQTWLSALGAQGLSVVQTSAFGEDSSLEFRLGRHPA